MSLQVWLPLMGDLHNQGTSNAIFTGTPTYAAGKIGQCLSNGTIKCTNTDIPITISTATQYSICSWVKMTATSQWVWSIGSGTGTTRGLWIGGANTGPHFAYSGSGAFTGHTIINDDIWHHVCFTVNGAIARAYVDGIDCGGSSSVKTDPVASNTITVIASSVKFINDFRIYDHCLSAAEVHEIAQGLVVHYKLNGQLQGMNDNLIQNSILNGTPAKWSNWGSPPTREIVTINGIKWMHIISNTTQFQGYSQNWNNRGTTTELTAGTKVTFSCLAYASAAASLAICGVHWDNSSGSIVSQSWPSFALATTPKQFSTTFTVPTNCDRFNIMLGDSTNTAHELWIARPKLELGSEMTAWNPTYNEMNIDTTQITDSSGYGHNGTITGTLTLNNDTPRYSNATYGGNNITSVAATWNPSWLNSNQTFTCNVWINKKSQVGSDWNTIFRYANSNVKSQQLHFCYKASSILLSRYSDDISISYTIPTDQWIMLTWTGSGRNESLYINGEFKQTVTHSTDLALVSTAKLMLFKDAVRNNYGSDIMMSDFRLYCTTLSADDILSLYHTGAKIDNLNGLHTFEFQESGPAQITKQGQIKGDIIQETYSPFVYDIEMYVEPDGSKWAHIFHHNNPAAYRFASTNTFTSSVYIDENRWFNFKSCDYLDKYEFLAKVKKTDTDTEVKYRWIQPSSPFTSTFNNTKSESVTKITTTGYTSCPFGGLYHVSGSSWLAMNNGVNNNWFGATGAWTAWNGGIPGWASTASGDAIKSGSVDIYVRLDNASYSSSELPAKLFKDFKWQGNNLIEL